MSSNIRLKKICQHCGQSFIAQKIVTKFCSLPCAQRNYKKRKRAEKITQTIIDINNQAQEGSSPLPSKENVEDNKVRLNREWINIKDVARLLGIGERTLYRVMKDRSFPKLKIGKRLLFNKQYVLDYFIHKTEDHERKIEKETIKDR